MNSTFHQTLNVNTFKTEVIHFSSELHMEGTIIQNPGLIELEVGNIPEILASQFSINCNGNNKRIDLIIKNDEKIGIVELKKGIINLQAVSQLVDYLSISNNINSRLIEEEIIDPNSIDSNSYFGVLVGTGIEENALKEILNRSADSQRIYVIILQQFRTHNDQLFLTSNVLIKPNSNIANNQNSRFDFTKYKFNNEIYGKGRLVLAVIKEFVKNKNNTTIEEINSNFPSVLKGSYKIAINNEELETSDKLRKRYFVNNPIELSNGVEIVVTNQWGIGNIGNFIKKAEELNFIIEEVKS